MVPDKIVVGNIARTSAPKKDRIEMLFGTVVYKIGAQHIFEKLLSNDDFIGRLVNE